MRSVRNSCDAADVERSKRSCGREQLEKFGIIREGLFRSEILIKLRFVYNKRWHSISCTTPVRCYLILFISYPEYRLQRVYIIRSKTELSPLLYYWSIGEKKRFKLIFRTLWIETTIVPAELSSSMLLLYILFKKFLRPTGCSGCIILDLITVNRFIWIFS